MSATAPDLNPAPPSSEQAWRALHQRSSAPYRRHGRFAWHFARGKLQRDPIFRGLLGRGDLAGRARVLDIGCGQGLLASLLQQAAEASRHGDWPAEWPHPPAATAYTGIEMMPKDVASAQTALADLPLAPQFVCGDMRFTPLPECDLVVILDVLHYVDHAAQLRLLERVRAALSPQGRLLLRIGDQSSLGGFRVSQWVDHVVCRVRGLRAPHTACRSLGEWLALLEGLGFTVQAVPMSQGTPFANVLLVADRAAETNSTPAPMRPAAPEAATEAE
jgi:SAM-dependent methyltransferase